MEEEGFSLNKKYFYGYIVAILCSSFQFGYGFCCFNPIIRFISAIFNWSDSQENLYEGIITTILSVGAVIGAFAAEKLVAKGRRFALYIANAFLIIGSVLNIISNFYCLLLGRFIQGIGVGIGGFVAPIYIREITPVSFSGFMGSFHQITIVFAIIFPMIFTIGAPTDKKALASSQIWRGVFLFPIAISVIQLTLITFVYFLDTPKYYVGKGDTDNAKKVLTCLYSNSNEKEKVLEKIETAKASQKISGGISFLDLIGPVYRWVVIIGIVLSFFQQFSGINVIAFYSTEIFSDGGKHNPTIPNLLFSLVNFAFTIIASLFADRFGRKTLLIFGSASIAICMIIIGSIYDSNAYSFKVLFILIFVASFAMSHGPICWVYSAEILPPEGFSIAVASNFIFTIIIGLITPILLSSIKNLYFFLFAFIMIIAFLFTIFFLPETKGLGELEIRKLFRINLIQSDGGNPNNGYLEKEEKNKEILL